MKTRTQMKKCMCNSTTFREFDKYSQSLNCIVKYLQCQSCGHITIPESKKYDLSKIYNTNYFTNIDYGWKGRAELVVKYIKYLNILLPLKKIQICDFGAGNGYLSKLLIESKFNVLSYEPYLKINSFLDYSYYRDKPFRADVLLMVEVFEHFTNAFEEINNIVNDFQRPELIIFTTVLIDDANDTVDKWFYSNPDAGHFTLWSEKSLSMLGEINGYKLVSLNTYLHILCKKSNKSYYNRLKILSLPPNLIVSLKKLLKKVFK